jgi:hypothetical protein
MAFRPSIQGWFNERVRAVHATFSFVTEILAGMASTGQIRLTMQTLLSKLNRLPSAYCILAFDLKAPGDSTSDSLKSRT